MGFQGYVFWIWIWMYTLTESILTIMHSGSVGSGACPRLQSWPQVHQVESWTPDLLLLHSTNWATYLFKNCFIRSTPRSLHYFTICAILKPHIIWTGIRKLLSRSLYWPIMNINRIPGTEYHTEGVSLFKRCKMNALNILPVWWLTEIKQEHVSAWFAHI